jgi:predicted nucleic acid-binding protein
VICIDSSVAAKWFFDEDHSAEAPALLNDTLTAAEPIIAPHMLPSEVTNIIRQRIRQGILNHDDAQAILARFLAIPIAFHAQATLYGRALTIANEYNLPAVYDAHYIALAEMAGATLWTADQRLLRTLGGAFAFIRPIAEYDLS